MTSKETIYAAANIGEDGRPTLNHLNVRVRPEQLRMSVQRIPGNEDDWAFHTHDWIVYALENCCIFGETVELLVPHASVHIWNQSGNRTLTLPEQINGIAPLGYAETIDVNFYAQLYVSDSNFQRLVTMAAARPDADMQITLHFIEPLSEWDEVERIHIERAVVHYYIEPPPSA